MKTFLNVLSIVFLVLGLAFTILPLGTIAFLPLVLALICAAIALYLAKDTGKKLSKALLVIGAALALAVIVKLIVVKHEIEPATEEEMQQQEQVDQENLNVLEELEALEELEELEGLE